MSEAQPLGHQAFRYLHLIYGDNPLLVNVTQPQALELYRVSFAGAVGKRVAYLAQKHISYVPAHREFLQTIGEAYVQGTSIEDMAVHVSPPISARQVLLHVSDLAFRVAAAYHERGSELPTITPNESRSLHSGDPLPLEEQNRLFDILREEETQRTLLEKRTREPQEPSAISRVCHGRIVASITHIAEAAVQAHGSALGHEKVDQIARQAIAVAVWDYARLSDGQEFLPFVEGAMEQALQKEIDEQLSVPETESSNVDVVAHTLRAESAPEGPNPQAQQYLKEIFGDNAAIGSRMTQADAERLLTATIVLMEGPYAFQHAASGLRAHEVVTKYVKGLSAEEIVTQCGLSRFANEQLRDPHFYVKDVARRIIGSYTQLKGRPPRLADFWRPPGLYADIGERITRYYPTLLNFAMMVGRNVHSVILSPEDAVQDAVGRVLVRVERAKKEGDWDIKFNVNYFQTTIRRVYADHARTVRSRSILPFGDMRVLDSLITIKGVDEYTETERQMIIRRALHKIALHLSGHPRKELLWEAWMGVSPVVLGRRYSISPRAVQKNVAKARKLLRVMVVRGEIELPEDFS